MTPDLCRKNAALLCTICVFFLFCEDPLFGSAVFHFTTGFSSVKGKQLRCTQILVDFCPDEQQVHTKIQPQHHNHKRRKASVEHRHIAGIFQVNGKYIGKYRPCDRGKDRTRQLADKRHLPVWEIRI